jgi:hypothetical protein
VIWRGKGLFFMGLRSGDSVLTVFLSPQKCWPEAGVFPQNAFDNDLIK